MDAFRKVVHGVAHGMSMIGAFVLLAIMVLTCVDVTGRYFGYPIPGTYDLVGIGGGAVLALGIGMSHVVGMKINMDPLYKRPAILQRIVNCVVSILSVGTLALISWRCFKLGYDLFRRGRVSDTIQIPLYPFLYLAGIGMSIYCLVLLVEALKPAGQQDAPRRGRTDE